MKVRYFAWLRERLNRGEDEVSPPPDVVTVADLIAWLRRQDDSLDLAMANPDIFKYSINARLVSAEAPIADAREVAILPPMTGG